MLNTLEKKSSFFYFFIFLLLHIISARFYFLYDFDAFAKDTILIISLFLIILNIHRIKIILNKDDKYIYIFFLYSFIASCIMAMFNFNQPFSYSLLASRILIVSMILFIAINFVLPKINIRLLYKSSYFIAIFIFIFSFYMYFTSDFSLIYKDTTYAFRFDNVRITIAPETLVLLLFFFYYHSKEKTISLYPFIGLFLTLVFVNQTRSVLLAVLIVLSISFINFKNKKTLYGLFFIVTVTILSIIFTNFESSIFQPLINMYENTASEVSNSSGNINVRALELAYFLDFLDLKSIIFGFGMDNNRFIDIYYDQFYLSDLGIFKVFYLYGVIGFIFFIIIYYKLYKMSKKYETPLHKTGRALVLFQLFAPTLNTLHNLEGIFTFFVIYVLIKEYNNIRRKLNG